MRKHVTKLVVALAVCAAPAIGLADPFNNDIPGSGSGSSVLFQGFDNEFGSVQLYLTASEWNLLLQLIQGANIPAGDPQWQWLWNLLAQWTHKPPASVPEPGTLSLFAVSALGLLWAGRRRRVEADRAQ